MQDYLKQIFYYLIIILFYPLFVEGTGSLNWFPGLETGYEINAVAMRSGVNVSNPNKQYIAFGGVGDYVKIYSLDSSSTNNTLQYSNAKNDFNGEFISCLAWEERYDANPNLVVGTWVAGGAALTTYSFDPSDDGFTKEDEIVFASNDGTLIYDLSCKKDGSNSYVAAVAGGLFPITNKCQLIVYQISENGDLTGTATKSFWERLTTNIDGDPVTQYFGYAHPTSVSWNPSNNFIATVAETTIESSKNVVIYEFTGSDFTYKNGIYLNYKTDLPYKVDWSADGQYLAVGTQISNKVYVYEVDSSSGAFTYKDSYSVTGTPHSICWMKSEKILVGAGNYSKVLSFDGSSISEVESYNCGTQVNCANWSFGKRYAVVGLDNTAAKELMVAEFKSPVKDRNVINTVAVRPSGSAYVAVGGDSKTFSTYLYNESNTNTLYVDRNISNEDDAVINALAWSSTGRFLAVGGASNSTEFPVATVYSFEDFHDIDSDVFAEKFWGGNWLNRYNYGSEIRDLDWNKPTNPETDPTYLAVVGEFDSTHEELTVYQLTGSSLIEKDTEDYGTNGPVNCVGWRPEQNQLIAGGFNLDGSSEIILYDFDGSSLSVNTTKGFTETSAKAIRAFDWHPTGSYVAVAFVDRVYVLDASLNEVLPSPYYVQLSSGSYYINSVKWYSDGSLLLIGLEDSPTIRIYKFENETLTLFKSDNNYSEIKSVDWLSSLKLRVVGGVAGGSFDSIKTEDGDSVLLTQSSTIDWYIPNNPNNATYVAMIDSVSGLTIYEYTNNSLVEKVSLNDFTNTPTFVRWQPNHSYIVVGGDNIYENKNIKVYKFDSSVSSLKSVFSDNWGNVSNFEWLMNGDYFAFSNSDTLFVGFFDDSNSNNLIYNDYDAVVDCGSKINSISCTKNDRYISVGCDQGASSEFQIYLLDNERELKLIGNRDYNGNVNVVGWSPDNSHCYWAGDTEDNVGVLGIVGGSLTGIDLQQSWTLNYRDVMKGVVDITDTLHFGDSAKVELNFFGNIGNIFASDSVVTLSRDTNITGIIIDANKTLKILGGNHTLNLFHDQTLSSLKIIGKNVIFNCHNKSITLYEDKTLGAGHNSILHLKNCTLNINHHQSLFLETESSKLILENCTLDLSSNFSIDKGSLEFRGNVSVQSNGEYEFVWKGCDHVISADSKVEFHSGITLIMHPVSSSSQFLTFEDKSAKLVLDGASLVADENINIAFSECNFVVKNNVQASTVNRIIVPEIYDSSLRCADVPYVVDWSSSGNYLAVGGDSSSSQYDVKVYEYNNGNLLLTTSVNLDGNANALAWSPNGDYLAIVDIAHNRCLIYFFSEEQLSLFCMIGFGDKCYDVTWSPNGEYLALAGSNNEEQIQIYRFTESGVEKIDSFVNTFARAIDWDPLGNYIAVGYGTKNEDNVLSIYEFDFTNELLNTTAIAYDTAGTSSVNSVKWSNNGNFIAIGQNNGFVKVFEFNRETPDLAILDSVDVGTNVYGISWSKDNDYLACQSNDNQLSVYSVDGSGLELVYEIDI